MAAKLPGELITKVALNDATFKGTGASFEPTYINYIFGNNGTGKSTIAKSIFSGSGVSYAPKITSDDCNVLLYDQDFIKENVKNYNKLPGVFTINSKNVGIQDQIDEISGRQNDAQKTASAAAAVIEKIDNTEMPELNNQLYKDCWNKTADLREEYTATQERLRSSKQKFTQEIQKHEPVEHDPVELKRMYDSAYAESPLRYTKFTTIQNTAILDSLPGSEILSTVIVNTADTDFAKFLKKVGSTKWMRQGHTDYQKAAGDQCPYCSQELPHNFNQILKDSFDSQYDENLILLDDFLTRYKDEANNLYIELDRTPDPLYHAITVKPYKDKLEALKGIISGNIEKIRQKKENPAASITLDETKSTLDDLSGIISGFNSMINKNNEIVDAGPKMQADCKKAVFEYMAFCLKDVLEAYERSKKKYKEEKEKQQGIVDSQTEIINNFTAEIKRLSSKTVETETAMKNINEMLKDAGFQGFEVRPHQETVTHPDGTTETITPSPVIHYDVIRTATGEIADNLSEGEKNFIAFMYFLQQVFGNESEDVDTRGKIVVIDDPVSSMDSSALFIVGAQIRRMIEICRNAVHSENPVVSGNFIKQIFILTHNAYFHREVTYLYADQYEFVSFYLVKKHDNKSSIELKDAINPDCPTERINVNPVKDSYVALWTEYKEATSGITLTNVIRRILEYYFLQICGYSSDHLRKVILEGDGKYALTHDEYGKEDLTKYNAASTMLSYITSGSSLMNDGIHYSGEGPDPDRCREVFEMIFDVMNQKQHFDMMMKIK